MDPAPLFSEDRSIAKKVAKPKSALGAALQALRRSKLRLEKVRGMVDDVAAGLEEIDGLLKQHQAERLPTGSLLAELQEKVRQEKGKAR